MPELNFNGPGCACPAVLGPSRQGFCIAKEPQPCYCRYTQQPMRLVSECMAFCMHALHLL